MNVRGDGNQFNNLMVYDITSNLENINNNDENMQ
jgi:hypothetical protein